MKLNNEIKIIYWPKFIQLVLNQVTKLLGRFKNGEMSIDDKHRSRYPKTARIDENIFKKSRALVSFRRQSSCVSSSDVNDIFYFQLLKD